MSGTLNSGGGKKEDGVLSGDLAKNLPHFHCPDIEKKEKTDE